MNSQTARRWGTRRKCVYLKFYKVKFSVFGDNENKNKCDLRWVFFLYHAQEPKKCVQLAEVHVSNIFFFGGTSFLQFDTFF